MITRTSPRREIKIITLITSTSWLVVALRCCMPILNYLVSYFREESDRSYFPIMHHSSDLSTFSGEIIREIILVMLLNHSNNGSPRPEIRLFREIWKRSLRALLSLTMCILAPIHLCGLISERNLPLPDGKFYVCYM